MLLDKTKNASLKKLDLVRFYKTQSMSLLAMFALLSPLQRFRLRNISNQNKS